MTSTRRKSGAWNGLAAVLAFLALALQALFPAGFMADTSGGAHHGIPIVICTAQGQVTADWGGPSDHGSKKSPAKPMGSCVFAGHAAATTPSSAPAIALAVAYAAPEPILASRTVALGQGLAAPPPPAIGPPPALLAV